MQLIEIRQRITPYGKPIALLLGLFSLFLFAGPSFFEKIPKEHFLLEQSANVAGFITYNYHNDKGNKNMNESKLQINPFADLALEAKAAFVFDARTKKPIFAYNENDVLPLASLTKVMTAIVALETLPEETVITVQRDDIAQEGDSGLLVGERWRLADILRYTLTTSSNDGASAIAAAAGSMGQNVYGFDVKEAKRIFIEKMNQKSAELGLLNTRFINETGLDVDENRSGGYGTAKEVAFLMRYALENNPDVIGATSKDSFTVSSLDGVVHTAKNTNTYLGKMPGVVASKTGFTDLAGGNLVVAADLGITHPVIVVVLGSTLEGRFSDVERLLWETLASFEFDTTAQQQKGV